MLLQLKQCIRHIFTPKTINQIKSRYCLSVGPVTEDKELGTGGRPNDEEELL